MTGCSLCGEGAWCSLELSHLGGDDRVPVCYPCIQKVRSPPPVCAVCGRAGPQRSARCYSWGKVRDGGESEVDVCPGCLGEMLGGDGE